MDRTFSVANPARRHPAIAVVLLGLMLALCVAASARADVTVRPGDTLSGIAARHGTSVQALIAANGLANPDRVVAGTTLRLPGRGTSSAGTWRVRPGDTLSGIASRMGVSASALAAANGITDPNLVRIGQLIRVGNASSGARTVPTASGAVRVRPGDTLSGIAARAGTSAAALAALNGIADPNRIRIGQVLRIGAAAGTSAPVAASALGSVRVATGETLSGIAARAGVSVGALAALNGITDPDSLAAGRTLRIPGGARTPASGSSPAVPRSAVGPIITQAAARHGVDPALARAIAWQESGFSQHMRSSAGAIGVMQLMPGTARWVGQDLLGRSIDAGNVYDNVDAGVAFIAWLQRRTGDTRKTAMSYYQGLHSVTQRGPYDDTVAYARSVMALMGRV